jgi:hypothetical protein
MKVAQFFLSCVLLNVTSPVVSTAQQAHRVDDLRPQWRVYEEGVWKPFDDRTQSPGTIYFVIDPLKTSGGRLVLEGHRDYSVWLNGSFLMRADRGRVSFDIDSLATRARGELNLAVHAKRGLEFLGTTIITPDPATAEKVDERRHRSALVDFSLLVFFILGAYFIALVRSNPRLTLEYFNMTKLVSLQERDESLVMGKITSSVSILVYIFIGLWASYLLLIVSNFGGILWIVANDSAIHSLADAFAKWGRITIVLFVAVTGKIMLVVLMARIFRVREGAAVQLINFFRLLAGLVMTMSIILVFYFVFDTVAQQYYLNLIILSVWMLGLWSVLIFVKLLNKSPFSIFHIISYLCASEFFPIIILFRVLFF